MSIYFKEYLLKQMFDLQDIKVKHGIVFHRLIHLLGIVLADMSI